MSPEFREFVTHPRYGQGPRFTGLNPENDYATGRVFLHWHSPEGVRIPNTAIPADVSRQMPATIPVTHYFDAKRRCADCGRPFLFFAAEQKYWYEELGFPLESDCVRCVACRKQQQGLELRRQRYEELFHVPERTPEENLEMAECALSLAEAGVFGKRQLERVRSILKKVPANSKLQALLKETMMASKGKQPFVIGLWGVRYQVKDVERSIAFYTGTLGFTLDRRNPPAFGQVSIGDLKLILSGPGASGSRPTPDGRRQEPGGWNRVVLLVKDLPARIRELKNQGVRFRNEMEAGPGGRQVQVEDPDGNPIELFEPAG